MCNYTIQHTTSNKKDIPSSDEHHIDLPSRESQILAVSIAIKKYLTDFYNKESF